MDLRRPLLKSKAVRNLFSKGIIDASVLLIEEIWIQFRLFLSRFSLRRRRTYKRLLLMNPKKLNLACGELIFSDWINVDLHSNYADFKVDVREHLPFSNGTFDFVFAQAILEHVIFPDEAYFLLSEIFRVLRKGGVASIGVPDTERNMRRYFENDVKFFMKRRHGLSKWAPEWIESNFDILNFLLYQNGEHKYSYNHDLLKTMLINTGFSEAIPRSFRGSKFPELNMDSPNKEDHVIYIDAVK